MYFVLCRVTTRLNMSLCEVVLSAHMDMLAIGIVG